MVLQGLAVVCVLAALISAASATAKPTPPGAVVVARVASDTRTLVAALSPVRTSVRALNVTLKTPAAAGSADPQVTSDLQALIAGLGGIGGNVKSLVAGLRQTVQAARAGATRVARPTLQPVSTLAGQISTAATSLFAPLADIQARLGSMSASQYAAAQQALQQIVQAMQTVVAIATDIQTAIGTLPG